MTSTSPAPDSSHPEASTCFPLISEETEIHTQYTTTHCPNTQMCQWHSADSEEVHRVSWYFWLCAFSVHLIHWSTVQPGHHQLGWGENVEIMSLYTRAISLPVGQLPEYDSIYMLDVLRYYPTDFEVCDTSATPAIRSLGIPSFLTSLIIIIILLCLFICWSQIPYSFHSLFPDSEQSLALCY